MPTTERRTRIVATVGPASDRPEVLEEMMSAGVDVCRISASHDSIDQVVARIGAVRTAAAAARRDVATMVDLCGPKLRVHLNQETVSVEPGDVWHITSSTSPTDTSPTDGVVMGSSIPPHVLAAVVPGTHIALGDGGLTGRVLAATEKDMRVEFTSAAHLRGRPGVHIPSDMVQIDPPTPEDRLVIEAAAAAGVDAIAVSFVNSPTNLAEVRSLAPHQMIVAKIETASAVRRLDEIIAAADAVMVARGDLGLEFSPAEVPFLQKRIIQASTAAGRPAITATQMLESMVSSPVPTRAEAADVVSAILDGTSCVMLSGETAIGTSPPTAVAAMADIARRADLDVHRYAELPLPFTSCSTTALSTHAVSQAAFTIADSVSAVAVVGLTDSGFTARALARWRASVPLIAATRSHDVVRRLQLSWGVSAVLVSHSDVDGVLYELVSMGAISPNKTVVVVSGVPGARASDTVAVKTTPSA